MNKLLRIARIGTLAICLALCGAVIASARLTVGDGAQLDPGESGAAGSLCPAGLEARKGGFSAGFGADGGVEVSGFKMHGRGWRVLATNTGEDRSEMSVESYCSPAAAHPLIQRSATVAVPPLAARIAVARCRGGETPLSGGFRNSIVPDGPHVVVDGMRGSGGRSIRVSATNLSRTAPGHLTAYVYCGHAPRPLVRSQTVAVPAGGKERLVARCPEKAHGFGQRPALFGGFQGSVSDPPAGAVSSPAQFRNFGDRVVVTAVNRDPGRAMAMTAFVYCR